MGEREGTNDGRGNDQGFSLIELIVALAVLGVVLGAALPAMYSALGVSRNNRNRSVAANLASQEIDIVRDAASTSFTSLSTAEVVTLQAVDGTTYTIKRDGEWVAPGATSSACSSSSSPTLPSFMRITVFVTWPNMSGAPPVQNQTILSPPAGSFDPYKSAIGVQVKDAKNQPEPNTPVTLTLTTTPFTTQTLNTQTDGCQYFAGLAPGTYTVTLNRAFYVDGQFSPTATLTQTVKAGDSVQLQPLYDLSGNLSPTFASNAIPPGLVPAAALTVFNPSLTPSGTKVLTTTNGLYPYPSGYKVWAGKCADSDPEGLLPPPPTPRTAYYPLALRPAAVTVASSATTPVVVALRSVDVKPTKGSPAVAFPVGTSVTVTAVHNPDANSCIGGDSLSVTGPADATGTVRIALPYGTWSFTATATVVLPAKVWSGPTSAPASVNLTPTTVTVPSVTVQTS